MGVHLPKYGFFSGQFSGFENLKIIKSKLFHRRSKNTCSENMYYNTSIVSLEFGKELCNSCALSIATDINVSFTFFHYRLPVHAIMSPKINY